jgi:hypothetical protein
MRLSRKDFRKFAEMTAYILWVTDATDYEKEKITSFVVDTIQSSNPLFDRQRFDGHVLAILAKLDAE